MLILELDTKFHKAGRHIETVGGKKFIRLWFGFMAITWTEFDLKTLHDYIAAGNTLWKQ